MTYACINGHTELINVIARQDQSQLNLRNEEGLLPIHFACLEGHLESVKVLLQLDPLLIDAITLTNVTVQMDRNTRRRHVVTGEDNLLHFACESGNLELVSWLCEHKHQALWAVPGRMDDLPWERALCYGHEELASELMKNQIHHVDPSVIPRALLPVLEGSHHLAQAALQHPFCQQALNTLIHPTQEHFEQLLALCISAMEHDNTETLQLLWPYVPWKSLRSFPILDVAMYENKDNITKFLWNHPSQGHEKMALLGEPFHLRRGYQILPDMAVLFLCHADESVMIARLRNVVREISTVQNLQSLKMILDGDWEAALTRLLGGVSEELMMSIDTMREVIDDIECEIIDDCSRDLIESPRFNEEFTEFVFERTDLYALLGAGSIDRALLSGNSGFANWATSSLKETVIMKLLTEQTIGADLRLSVRAAEQGRAEVLEYLFQHYPHDAVVAGGEAFEMACVADEEAAGRVLLQYLPEQQMSPDLLKMWMNSDATDYATPIDAACYYQWNLGIIRQMLELTGPQFLYPLEGEDVHRRYPLLSAAMHGDLPLFNMLLEFGGTEQITALTKGGYTLMCAICQVIPTELSYLTALSDAKIVMAKRALEIAPQFENTSYEGTYPIHYACKDGLTELARFLLERPISRSLLDKTPGVLLKTYHTPHITRLVLSYLHPSQLLHVDNGTGKTALHSVVRTGSPLLVQYVLNLLESHPHILHSLYRGRTCLDCAIAVGQNDDTTLQIVKLIVENLGVRTISEIRRDEEGLGYSCSFDRACVGLPLVVAYFLDILPTPPEVTPNLLLMIQTLPDVPNPEAVKAEIVTVMVQRGILNEVQVRQIVDASTMARVCEMLATSRTKSARSDSFLGKRSR